MSANQVPIHLIYAYARLKFSGLKILRTASFGYVTIACIDRLRRSRQSIAMLSNQSMRNRLGKINSFRARRRDPMIAGFDQLASLGVKERIPEHAPSCSR